MSNFAEITDEFAEPNGEWTDYQSIVPEQNEAIRTQKHVDIRSFVPDKPAIQVSMFVMDGKTMLDLDGGEISLFTHDSIPSATIFIANNEGWTYGTVGPQSDRHNWNGIKAKCPAGQVTTTQSVITTLS